jgi:hypothetical protein
VSACVTKTGRGEFGAPGNSANKARTVEGEAIQGAEHGYRNSFGLKKISGDDLQLFAGDGFDPGQNFVQGIETAEVKLLAG